MENSLARDLDFCERLSGMGLLVWYRLSVSIFSCEKLEGESPAVDNKAALILVVVVVAAMVRGATRPTDLLANVDNMVVFLLQQEVV